MSKPSVDTKKAAKPKIIKVSDFKEVPGQLYRSPDCKTFYWRQDDHSDFGLRKRRCHCVNHPANIQLDDPRVLYQVTNEMVPEVVWVERPEDVPAGIYFSEEDQQVVARADPAGDFKVVKFDLFREVDEQGRLILVQGVPSQEVVARVDGKLYRIPLELIPGDEEAATCVLRISRLN